MLMELLHKAVTALGGWKDAIQYVAGLGVLAALAKAWTWWRGGRSGKRQERFVATVEKHLQAADRIHGYPVPPSELTLAQRAVADGLYRWGGPRVLAFPLPEGEAAEFR